MDVKNIIIENTKNSQPFPVDARGFYHNIMSLIISQRIRFSVARNIRKRIYIILNESNLDKVMDLTSDQRIKAKLSDDKWEIMYAFHKSYNQSKEKSKSIDIKTIKGIGVWTEQCAKIMCGDYTCGFISSDLAVRKELARILNKKKLSENECDNIMKIFDIESAGRIFSILWNRTRN